MRSRVRGRIAALEIENLALTGYRAAFTALEDYAASHDDAQSRRLLSTLSCVRKECALPPRGDRRPAIQYGVLAKMKAHMQRLVGRLRDAEGSRP